jgi:hypothetical protein
MGAGQRADGWCRSAQAWSVRTRTWRRVGDAPTPLAPLHRPVVAIQDRCNSAGISCALRNGEQWHSNRTRFDARRNLGRAGAAIWDDVLAGWELRADELCVLEQVAHEVDLIAQMQAELDAGAPLVVMGSMKQPPPSPYVSEIRQHRSCLKTLLAALGLNEDGGRNRGVYSHRGAATVSEAARKAARARWGSGGMTSR